MTTGQRIKDARKKAGMTQKELGLKLGVTYQTIAQWENDLRNPKQETLSRIASALGVHWLDLAGDASGSGMIVRHPTPEQEEAIFSAIEAGLREKQPDLFDYENELGYKALMRVDEAFTLLNDDGINEAVKRVEELTEIPRYQRQSAPQSPPAPQPGTDTPSQKKPPESP